jgi:hypothetical protein
LWSKKKIQFFSIIIIIIFFSYLPVQHKEVTSMDAVNLAIVVGPNILKPPGENTAMSGLAETPNILKVGGGRRGGRRRGKRKGGGGDGRRRGHPGFILF